MLTLQNALIAAALVVAAASYLGLRRARKRLERLAESYWELRYEYGQLRARVDRLEHTGDAESEASQTTAPTSFIPLSSLKR